MTAAGNQGGGVMETAQPRLDELGALPFGRMARLNGIIEVLRSENWPVTEPLTEEEVYGSLGAPVPTPPEHDD